MELTSIPGVGEKTATALSTLEDPGHAIETGDVAAIATAPGISPSRAARIARSAIKARHGDDTEFLATDRARAIYQDLLALLQARAETEFAKHRLETIYPTGSADRIEEVRSITKTALDREPNPAIYDSLQRVEPLDSPSDLRIRDRCFATGDAERYEVASQAVPEMSVEIVDDAHDVADLARGYAHVIVLDEGYAGLDLADHVAVRPDALDNLDELVPERTLAFFAHNRDSIRAAIDVTREAGLDVPTDLEGLEQTLERLNADGTPAGDEERDRLQTALDDLDVSVDLAQSVANDEIRDALRERDVTVDGTDLLSLVEQGAGVDALVTRELSDEFADAIDDARSHLVDALALTDDEATHAEQVFPQEPTFPVPTNDPAVERLRDDLRAAHDRRSSTLKRTLATELADDREAVEGLVSQALDLDLQLAISRFATDFRCTLPRFDDAGFTIEGGRSPLLDIPPEEVDPVDYAVSDVVLLSGVNSGGKTSLLDLVGATAILAHMGLPVPAAHARLQRFDALHYHAATQGTLDAGAFEATVRQFAELATGSGERLVLVDELESITEPGAAAIIVGGILEEMQDEATAVFVSHLANEIRDVTDTEICVDGIAASGVEDGELIVDRTPVKGHLARSTPELIVEQLAERSEGPQAAVYNRLLGKFN